MGQVTTTGLAYLRCSSGTPNFVANDGIHHWALFGTQLAEWVGPTIDPPDPGVPTLLQPLSNLICAGLNDSKQDACLVAGGTTTLGFLDSPGASSVYEFRVDASAMQVHVDLTNLSADYDLYLFDASDSPIGQSVQEGTSPEAVDAVVGPGDYFVFVHSDPGRDVDPSNPFVLHLDASPPPSAHVSPSAN
jgi:hypothetical protein